MRTFQFSVFLAVLTSAQIISAQADFAPRAVLPDAVVDLRTTDGVARVNAQWRYSDTTIDKIRHRDVGPDLKATGKPIFDKRNGVTTPRIDLFAAVMVVLPPRSRHRAAQH